MTPEIVEDILFVSKMLAHARVVSGLDDKRIVKLLNADDITNVINPSPFSGDLNHHISSNLRKALALLAFTARELETLIPSEDVLSKATEDAYNTVGVPPHIRKAIDDFALKLSEPPPE